MWKLPDTATAPFCPSEVRGSVEVSSGGPAWKRILQFLGPGLLISVGYMDPGNWATDIEAGSRFGFQLLVIVLLSSIAAVFLQCLALRLGIAAEADLAQVTRAQCSKRTTLLLWGLAEISIIACDLAEVLGCALAFHLLLGVSLPLGVILTAFDTLIVLGLKGKGFRQVEAIVIALIAVIGLCYFYELWMIQPDWKQVAHGFVPNVALFSTREPWYLAIGILGATVMPHNLYLHSSVVQTRKISHGASPDSAGAHRAKRDAIRFSTLDTVASLTLAFFVNAAILVLAGSAFHGSGHQAVTDIEDAFHLLEPLIGSTLAPLLFGIALLAAGQSSTFTGTIAGQIIMEGHLDLKIPCWKRRLITRLLALVPAYLGVMIMGNGATGKLLVFSQVVLSLHLPFAIFPLIRFNSRREVVGDFKLSRMMQITAWSVFALITIANLWLLSQIF